MEDKKNSYLKSLKVDYYIFNEIESILNDDVDNHVKLNLISDVINQEVHRVLDEVYEEGYYQGEEQGEENSGSLAELRELRGAMEEIFDLAEKVLYL